MSGTPKAKGHHTTAALVVGWVVAVISIFVGSRVEVVGAAVARWLSLFADLGFAALVISSASGVGMRLLDYIPLPGLTSGERLGAGTLVGLGATSLVWLVVGWAGLLNVWWGLLTTIALAALSWSPLASWWGERSVIAPPPSPLVRVLVQVVIATSLARALLPPSAFDGLFYHLFAPQQWIAQGEMKLWQTAFPLFFPHLVETLFLPAMVLRSDIAATLLHFAFLPIVCWLVWDISSRFVPSGSPWLAVALALGVPVLPVLAAVPYTDVAYAAMQVGTLWAVLHWRESSGRGWLTLAGILAGFAMATKYTGCVLPVTVVAIVLTLHRRSLRDTVPSIAVFAVPAVLVAAPWYAWTYAQTGNPFYPFLFGGLDWDPARAAHYAQTGSGLAAYPLDLLRLPLTVSLDGSWDGNIGVLPLALLPASIWVWARRQAFGIEDPEAVVILILVAAATAQAAFWLCGVLTTVRLQQDRMLLTGVVLLMPVFASTLNRLRALDDEQFRPGALVNSLILGVLVLTALGGLHALAQVNPLRWLVGMEDRTQYYAQRLGGLAAAMEATQTLPPDSTLLLLFEPRGYLAHRLVQPDAIHDEFEHRLRRAGSEAALARQLVRSGYTHLLIAWGNVDLMLTGQEAKRARSSSAPGLSYAKTLAGLKTLATKHAREVWRSSDAKYRLYALDASGQ